MERWSHQQRKVNSRPLIWKVSLFGLYNILQGAEVEHLSVHSERNSCSSSVNAVLWQLNVWNCSIIFLYRSERRYTLVTLLFSHIFSLHKVRARPEIFISLRLENFASQFETAFAIQVCGKGVPIHENGYGLFCYRADDWQFLYKEGKRPNQSDRHISL